MLSHFKTFSILLVLGLVLVAQMQMLTENNAAKANLQSFIELQRQTLADCVDSSLDSQEMIDSQVQAMDQIVRHKNSILDATILKLTNICWDQQKSIVRANVGMAEAKKINMGLQKEGNRLQALLEDSAQTIKELTDENSTLHRSQEEWLRRNNSLQERGDHLQQLLEDAGRTIKKLTDENAAMKKLLLKKVK
jgi:hypothetical protein